MLSEPLRVVFSSRYWSDRAASSNSLVGKRFYIDFSMSIERALYVVRLPAKRLDRLRVVSGQEKKYFKNTYAELVLQISLLGLELGRLLLEFLESALLAGQ